MIDDVQFAGAVEVDDWHERFRMTIKEELYESFVAASNVVVVVILIARFHCVVVAQLH